MNASPELAWEAIAAPDRGYYDFIAPDGVEFPAYGPPRAFMLRLPEVRIGRADSSQGVDPEIDLSGASEDRAISHLHAFLLRQPDGSYALVDPGSKNGTRLNDDPTKIATHAPFPLADGDEIHLGYWTTIRIRARAPAYGPGVSTGTGGGFAAPGPTPVGDARPPLVWLLCADIEKSSVLFQRSPDRYAAAIDEYEGVIGETCTRLGGTLVSTVDDTAVMWLPGPDSATEAALAIEGAFGSARSGSDPFRVRIGIHAEHAGASSTQISPVTTGAAVAVCLAGHGGQVLVSEAAEPMMAASLAAGFSLIDLGAFRLTDLRGPQRLYQLVHASLDQQEFPPPYSLDSRPHNLPERFTKFIGRGTEIEHLRQLITDNRLCTVTGSGGAGKTRLALHVAAQALESFPGGLWFADLSEVTDGDLVASAVSAALGIQQGGSGTYAAPDHHEEIGQTEHIVDHLQHRKALLVLDRCEHVLDAVARLADELLRECAAVRILVTSRESLRLPGEAVFHLGPLDLPSRWASLAELRQYASVRLFVDRAMLQDPDLVLSDDALRQVASICQRLDGIPFAIELAAARVKVLAIAQIAAMLDDLMADREVPRGASSHQATLRATIEWSYELLDERQQTLLRRLSVFAGGFTLDAAKHVCTGQGLTDGEVLGLLTDLVAKSLVEPEAHPTVNRYRLLETTRQYAIERLVEAEEATAVRAAHLDWFLTLAGRAAIELTGPRQHELLDLLEADHENLRAAFDAAKARQSDDELRLAASLGQFWLVRGLISEGQAWLDEALDGSAGTSTLLRAEALCAAGMLACFAGDFGNATRRASEALTVARDLDSRRWQGHALSLLGLVASGDGRHDEAEQFHAEAISSSRDTGDWWLTAFALTNLGNVLALRGATVEARTRYEESIDLRREHGDTWGLVWGLFRLGTLTTWEGAHEHATVLLEESLQKSRLLGFRQGTLLALLGLGEAFHVSGDQLKAGARYAEALSTARQLEEPTVACLALVGLADVALAKGSVLDAVTYLTEEETIDAERSHATLAALRRSRARLAAAQGNDVAAEQEHREALLLLQQGGDRRGLVEQLEELALVAFRVGQPIRSASLMAAAQGARARMGLPVPAVDRDRVEAVVDRLEASPDDEVRAAWMAGSTLDLDEAASLATVSVITTSAAGVLGELLVHPREGDVDRRLENAREAWIEDLGEALAATVASGGADGLLDRYRDAFGPAYWTNFAPAAAAEDVVRIERSIRQLGRSVDSALGRARDASDGLLDLRLFSGVERLAVADVLPVLENFGLRILDEHLYQVRPKDTPPLWIHDFGLTCSQIIADLADDELFPLFEDAFAQVWQGVAESDGLDRLVLGAGMPSRDVTVLRAYSRYLLQINNAFGQIYMERTLAAHPHIARLLVALFRARSSPVEAGRADRDEVAARITSEIVDAIDQLASLDEDRVLRSFLAVIQATLRTNFFQTVDGRPKDRLSFKLDPAAIPDLPAPRPLYEIFVYSTRVEGVHLRGGKVARGGIRWSDRHEDFRTEVLGLMKAQTVKNVVIIPVGAKGGFVVKQPPADPAARAGRGQGLLSHLHPRPPRPHRQRRR